MKNAKFLALCAITAVAALSHHQDAAAFGGFNPLNALTGMAQNQAQQRMQPQNIQNPQNQRQASPQYNQNEEVIETTTVRRINGKIVKTTVTESPDTNAQYANPRNNGQQRAQTLPQYERNNGYAVPQKSMSQPEKGYVVNTQSNNGPSNGEQFMDAGGNMVKSGGKMIGAAASGVADTTRSLFDKIQNIRLPEGQPTQTRDPNYMP